MPLTVLRNNQGTFSNQTAQTGVSQLTGWWNSIAAADFDNDGDMDYVVTNTGLNTFYKATAAYPVRIYHGDLDGDGNYDAFPSVYMPEKEGGKMVEYPAHTRDDALKQMIALRGRHPRYHSFATTPMADLFTPEEKMNMQVLTATESRSMLFQNLGNGRFKAIPLPPAAQWAPIYGIVIDDLNADGWLDIALNGNDYGTEVVTGRYNALNGLILLGKGNGEFEPASLQQGGLFIPDDGKALVAFLRANGLVGLAASSNRGPVRLFEIQDSHRLIQPLPHEYAATITLSNQVTRRCEWFWGTSFLSQSARYLRWTPPFKQVEFIATRGEKRLVTQP